MNLNNQSLHSIVFQQPITDRDRFPTTYPWSSLFVPSLQDYFIVLKLDKCVLFHVYFCAIASDYIL